MEIPTTMLLASNIFRKDNGCNFVMVNSNSVSTTNHLHDFYEFFIIVEGQVIHRINNQTQHLKPGNIVFVRPTDTHYYEKFEQYDFKFYNFAFTKEVYELLLNYVDLVEEFSSMDSFEVTPLAYLSSSQIYNLNSDFSHINYAEIQSLTLTKIIYRKTLAIIFQSYYSAIYKTTNNKSPDWLEGLCLEMQDKENFIKGIPMLISKSGKSHEHICREFQKYLSVSPSTYINGIRLNYAKNLLINTDMQIIDIAMDSGFENLSHFYHLFKKTYGESPKQLRKSNKTTIIP